MPSKSSVQIGSAKNFRISNFAKMESRWCVKGAKNFKYVT